MNMVRLRLWNDPFDEDGNSYGAGGNDIETTLALAKRAKEKGNRLAAGFPLQRFLGGPRKQIPPKAWQGMNEDELTAAVYDYTAEVRSTSGKEDILPQMVAVGNELTNGLLWPYGRVPDFKNIVRFINAGIRAVHETARGFR